MNGFTFSLIALFVFNGCNINTNERMDEHYSIAFNYIKGLPELESKCLYVSDTIVHLDLTNFWEELSKETENKEALLFKLDSIDNSRKLDDYYMSSLRNLNEQSDCNYTLFFSEVYENILLAEVLDNKGNLNANHYQLTAFNNSKIFLFKFNEKKEIVKVYSKELQYD